MAIGIIEAICCSCSCNEAEAKEHLEHEVRNLRELQELNDLRDSDIEQACADLGLESDYQEYFITALAG